MTLYDHNRKRQRLYFHDVDKPYPQRNTVEYVSMRLRQRYAVRTALQWLQIEGSSAIYKKMEDFVKIDVTRFGNHDTLVASGQLGTRNFITHWSSQLYVRVTALKKYTHEIPAALRAHHRDIVKGGTGFSGQVKLIGEQTYSVSGWLWKTQVQKSIQGSEEVRDVQIMNRGGLFTGGIGELGEPALWVLDCRWGGKTGDEEAWAYEEYETTMEVMGRWMHAYPRWNVTLLCPEGKDMRSLVKELERPDNIIRHGSWLFTPEISIQKDSIFFSKQEVFSMDGMGDVMLIMVCPEACNPVENVARAGSPLPHLFQDHSSKYKTARGDEKRRTPEEVLRLINAYLPKDWALILVGLTISVPAILEEGFRGSRILILDDNVDRTTILTEWIREHEGVHFEYHWEESETSTLPSKEVEEEEEDEEQMMTTPDLEALLQPIVEENEQGIPTDRGIGPNCREGYIRRTCIAVAHTCF